MANVLFLCSALFLSEPATAPSTAPSSQPALTMTIDVGRAPDLRDFADRAQTACKKMYPIICDDLASDGFTPPAKAEIEFDMDYKGVAATSGTHIRCSVEYFRRHPHDVGAIVHELVHVVQHYPKYDPVWLVEGIADYERFYRYEPLARRPHPTSKNASYKQGYQLAAAFLDWAQRTYDPTLVNKLNSACRETRDTGEVFRASTGKELDVLWSEYLKTLPPPPLPSAMPSTTRSPGSATSNPSGG